MRTVNVYRGKRRNEVPPHIFAIGTVIHFNEIFIYIDNISLQLRAPTTQCASS